MSSSGKTVLMVLTSHDKLGDTGEQTGWYLPEAAHPYFVFNAAGCKMEWASPAGGAAPLDAGSVQASTDDESQKFYSDEALKQLWSNTKPLADCKSSDYDAIFLVGGFGTMWDFPDNTDLQRLCKDIFVNGGVVSAVCHGPCGLLNVKGDDGELIVKGKEITAFTNEEEDAVKRREVVPFTNEDKFTEVGATFVKSGVFEAKVAVAGRIITGQNPPSAQATAEAVVAALKA